MQYMLLENENAPKAATFEALNTNTREKESDMTNSTTLISFNGSDLITTKVKDIVYVAMRPIVEGMGLDWTTQAKKLNNSEQKHGCRHIPTPTKSGIQEMLFIPIRKLNGWLFSINPLKVKEAIRGIVIKYQEECFEVLHDYWVNGKAINPRLKKEATRKALPNGLTIEQQDTIKAFHKELVQATRKDKQASMAITLWSAIKSKYGVTYKEAPPENFPDVLSLMSRTAVEKGVLYGEVLDPEMPETLSLPDNWQPLIGCALECHDAWRDVYDDLKQINHDATLSMNEFFAVLKTAAISAANSIGYSPNKVNAPWRKYIGCNQVVFVPFGLSQNREYRVVVRDGKIGRWAMARIEDAQDYKKPWGTLLVN